jgi:Tfp pilus assembly protein PilF
VRLRPENSATHINLANVLSRTGSLLEAKHQLDSAIRIGPGLAEARSAYAATLAENGGLEEARQRYEAALYLQLADAHNNLGTVLAALGNRAQVIEEYRIAVNDAPGSADANFNLGLTLAEQGRAAEAHEYLENALKLDPELFEAHLKLGEVLLAQGQAVRAAPHLRKAALSPNAQVRKAASELLMRLQ